MTRKLGRINSVIGIALFAALPAAADTYTVTLQNGGTFESRYKPQPAPWDAGKLLLLTDVGNWISLPRAQVKGVASMTEVQGFGRVIDTTTVDLGWGPNDRSEGGEEQALSPQDRLLQLLERQGRERRDYSVRQFVEPDQAGGIPLWFTDRTTPPLGGVQLVEPPDLE